MTGLVQFADATAEISRRVQAVKPSALADQLTDVTDCKPQELNLQQRTQWAEWQELRESPGARRQRTPCFVAILAAAVLTSLTPAASAGADGLARRMAAAAAVLCMAALFHVLVVENEMRRQHGYLTLVARHRIARSMGQKISLHPLRESLNNEVINQQTADEARLIVVAAEIIRSIQILPVWQTRYLDEHNCRYDVTGELAVLARSAIHLHDQRDSTNDHRPEWQRSSDEAYFLLLKNRVAWLYYYQQHIESLVRPRPVNRGGSDKPNNGACRQWLIDEARWAAGVLHEIKLPLDER
jgi:hypothetical protein